MTQTEQNTTAPGAETAIGQMTASLIYTSHCGTEIGHTGALIAQLIGQHGLRMERMTRLSGTQMQITCETAVLLIDLFTLPQPQEPSIETRIVLRLVPADPCDIPALEAALAGTIAGMIHTTHVDYVQWLQPDAMLTGPAFLAALGPARPRRVAPARGGLSRAPRLARIDARACGLSCRDAERASAARAQEARLVQRFRETPSMAELRAEFPDQAEAELNDIQRLSSWGMTGVLAFVAAPVAVTVAAINLTKGENLRLTSQAVAVSALMLVLETTGAMAEALAALPL